METVGTALLKEKWTIVITKRKPFIESFWFTTAMSVVALTILVDKVITLYSGDTRNLIGFPIWLLIAYHFIVVSYQSWKEPSHHV